MALVQAGTQILTEVFESENICLYFLYCVHECDQRHFDY